MRVLGNVFSFDFQGGDKLTLALGQNAPASSTSTTASTATSGSPNQNKLINLDSSPTRPAPPLPPPRTTSDPNYKPPAASPPKAPAPPPPVEAVNGDDESPSNIPVSVTHFSNGLNGSVEKETIFTDNNDAASIVRQHLAPNQNKNNNPFTPSKNPFLNGESTTANDNDSFRNNANDSALADKSLDEIVEQKIHDLINANPFTGKYNTIGRSNPFSSPNSSKNPFLDTRASNEKITSSGEDVHESPESSMEPIDAMEPAAAVNKIVSLRRRRMQHLIHFQVLSMSRHYRRWSIGSVAFQTAEFRNFYYSLLFLFPALFYAGSTSSLFESGPDPYYRTILNTDW